MNLQKQLQLAVILGFALLFGGLAAQAQVIAATVKCSQPGCAAEAYGTVWTLSIETTGLGSYNGNAVDLDAYANAAANNCSVPVAGYVYGGITYSSISGASIGIFAEAIGIEGTFEATYSEVNYLDGSLSITGAGSYPC